VLVDQIVNSELSWIIIDTLFQSDVSCENIQLDALLVKEMYYKTTK